MHTYKFLRHWELPKQLYAAKVISGGNCRARVTDVGCVDVSLGRFSWPHPHHFLPKHAVGAREEEEKEEEKEGKEGRRRRKRRKRRRRRREERRRRRRRQAYSSIHVPIHRE